ncbi:hypothetical protein N0Y54_00055 [Nostoc punctiforme UO1]
MAKVAGYYIERTATGLLRSLKGSGGSTPLHRIQLSKTVIQYSLD